MDKFSALLCATENDNSTLLSAPTTRAAECEYEFQSSYKLSRLSDFHGAIPDFSLITGSDNRYRCEATAAIRFVTEAGADLIDGAYAALPAEVQAKMPREALGSQLPACFRPSAEMLMRSRGEPFGLADLFAIKDETARRVLAQLIVYWLEIHVISREILTTSDSALPTLRIMEGSRIGDVVQSVVNGNACMSIITDIELDHGSSGPYVNIETAVLGPTVGRQTTKLSWQVRGNVFPMRRRTKAAGICLPVNEADFAEFSKLRTQNAKMIAEIVSNPVCVQLIAPAVFTQKRPRQGEVEVPVEGRAILDNKGFQLNQVSHGQDNAFYEIPDESFECLSKEELTDQLSVFAGCLSPTVPAYALRGRKWGFVALKSCAPVEYKEGLMDKLVLADSVKGLLLSLTDSFTKRGATGSRSDFIDGKAGGNVFLLHGGSGIGKTLTAEATAESLKRPLYRVASSDLGTSPDEISVNLERVLANSERWGAVTLLDEADIFLEARTSDNIQRNAIVGIFLQTLEYSSGVMFVTTNRVHNLDEAILPRISLGFSYPALNKEARRAIWSNFLDMHSHVVSQEDLDTLADFDFNGRQIKNVVNMAVTLASANKAPLSLTHLLPMANATGDFIKTCAKKPAANESFSAEAA